MKLLLITILIVISSTSAIAQSNAGREVLKLYREYEDAISRRDATVHERLFAPDYTYTPGNGNFMDRTEHIKFTKSGSVVVESLRGDNVRVRIYGKTAVVTGLWISVDKRVGNKLAERRIRFILVFVKRNGRWQIVAEQRTGIIS